MPFIKINLLNENFIFGRASIHIAEIIHLFHN